MPNYRNKMKRVVKHLLSLNEEELKAFFYADPFDKILRNISTRSVDGDLAYNNKRMLDHYPRSEAANKIVQAKNLTEKQKVKLLYLEHDEPISIIKKEILETKEKSPASVEDLAAIAERGLAVTLITKEEAGQIDNKYKCKMPDDGQTRYKATDISVITAGQALQTN